MPILQRTLQEFIFYNFKENVQGSSSLESFTNEKFIKKVNLQKIIHK
jgi:hypothetical protein